MFVVLLTTSRLAGFRRKKELLKGGEISPIPRHPSSPALLSKEGIS